MPSGNWDTGHFIAYSHFNSIAFSRTLAKNKPLKLITIKIQIFAIQFSSWNK